MIDTYSQKKVFLVLVVDDGRHAIQNDKESQEEYSNYI